MFHIDVYDFFPDLVRGDQRVLSYFQSKYFPRNWSLQLFSEDGQTPHTDEENPYIRVITSFEGDLPRELLEILGARITSMGYSSVRGNPFNLQFAHGYSAIETTDVKKDGKIVMNYGAVEQPFNISIIATNLASWYQDQDLLREVTNALHMPLLVPDEPLLSNIVLNQLSDLLYRVEHYRQ